MAGIQAAAGQGVGEDGSTGAAGVAMTGPAAAAAGLSRASLSSIRSLRSFDMNSTEDGGRWSFDVQLHVIINPRRMREDYGSRSVCVCVSVCLLPR